jgi:outer membrane receptor for ferric coprogen and ferric-rhodotorulic acid
LNNVISQGFGTGGLESGDNIANAETDVKVRGFPSPTLTNGFRTQVLVDTIYVGRMEKFNGPSSLLYGTGAISGVTNIMAKLPLSEARQWASVSVGSNSYYRGTVDFTGPISDTLGYRVVGAWTELETDEEFYSDRRQFLSALFRYQPFSSTELVVDVNTTRRRQEGTGLNDFSAGVTDPATGVRVNQFGDIFQQGRHVNFGGPDDFEQYDTLTYRAEVIQKFGDHFTLLVAGQKEDFAQDGRSLRDAGINPSNATLYRYAWHQDDLDRTVDQFRANLLTQFDFHGKHAIVLGRQEYSEVVNQDVFQGWFRNYPTSSIFPELNNRPDGSNPMLGNTPIAADARIRYAGETYVPPNARQTISQWISGDYLIYQGQFWDDRITSVLGYRWERSHNRRIQTIAPNHYNIRAQNDRVWARRSAADPDNGGMVIDPLVSRGTTVDGYSNKGLPLGGEYPTATVSFRVVDALSVYAQYSEGATFPSTAQRDGNGDGFPAQESEAREIGLKFELLGGKISGRIAAFELERLNAVRFGFSLPAPFRGVFDPAQPVSFDVSSGQAANPAGGTTLQQRTYLWDTAADRTALIAWHDADLQRGGEGLAFNNGNNGHRNRGSYANFDEQSDGFEFQLDFNDILPGWAVRLGYTRNDVVVTRGISNLADQVQQGGFYSPFHPAFTTLGDNFTNGPVLGNLASYTTDVRTSSFVDGEFGNFKKSDTPLHSFTVWSKYEFQNDALRGFSAGGGARYQSARTTDFAHGRNDRPQESREDRGGFVSPDLPESLLFDLFFSYSRQIADMDWTFQLNVRNLLDDQKLQAISLPPAGSTETNARNATQYLEPRDIRFTATVRF